MATGKERRPAVILMAEDDPEDRLLAEKVLAKAKLANRLTFVEDGRDLIDYLEGNGNYADRQAAPRPDLILLDLGMPGMDGRDALHEIYMDPGLRDIPVVVLTASKEDGDRIQSFDLGATAYVVKPLTLEGLVEAVGSLDGLYFELVTDNPG